MNQTTHGGDWAGFQARFAHPPLDFSANVSPLGPPPGVLAAARAAAADMERYPDPACRALRQKLAEAEHVPSGRILCGSGAAALLYRAVLARRPRRAMVTAPAFSEYEAALRLTDCHVERHRLREERNFTLDEGILEAIVPGLDMVFLTQPNNPTGVTVPKALLLKVLERCRKAGALLVMDECFCDFLDQPAAYTMRDSLEAYPNLLIVKAFTKLYAMAGLRLGYAVCADEAFLDEMDRCGPPWAVSTVAQAAGMAALEESNYVDSLRALIARQRPWLAAALGDLGLRVIPGEANFLLFQCLMPLAEPLARRGILLRRCANFTGLDESWYRTAVRTETENEKLIAALSSVLAEGEV